jgi:transposase InsO family protein
MRERPVGDVDALSLFLPVGRRNIDQPDQLLGLIASLTLDLPKQTTKADPAASTARDLVGRDFTAQAPNRLWVGESYLCCCEGVVYFSFVIDVLSRMIVGWRLAGSHAHRPGPRRAADGARRASAGG